jgi:hypothetical protein
MQVDPTQPAQAARMARFSGEARWGRAECVFSPVYAGHHVSIQAAGVGESANLK